MKYLASSFHENVRFNLKIQIKASFPISIVLTNKKNLKVQFHRTLKLHVHQMYFPQMSDVHLTVRHSRIEKNIIQIDNIIYYIYLHTSFEYYQ